LGAIFSSTVLNKARAHPASYTIGSVSFPEIKHPGRGVDNTPPLGAEVKERVDLYFAVFQPSILIYIRNKIKIMHNFSLMVKFNYIFFEMFRTSKCSSSGSRFVQFYDIISYIHISSLNDI
jgi:hypothetical protein